ncbi:MAG: TonB-dependent receptor [Bryobacterales bacterium]|nr:TonB-dependent receptor [Bryobacterales bacterium]MBV9396656.1 TonB-dependent receptor [Bryobacterales bacterium]
MKTVLLNKKAVALIAWVYALSASSMFGQAGNAGTVRGTVLDPSGAAIKGASVKIQNPVSHFAATSSTDDQGNFVLNNVPFNNYHVLASAPNFAANAQDIYVESPVPVELKMMLAIGSTATTVTVEAAADLVETDPATHTDIDRQLFDRLPLESQSSSLSSLVTLASPGVAADSNGLFHGLGDHASNSFSVDGQPITDQQSKVFSNQLPLDAVQSMEVIEGAPPAEYGDKTSLVIVVNTRSGLGISQPHGEVNTSFGSFGTVNGGANVVYGGQSWGNFISASGLNTGRFLDGPEFTILHSQGNQQNFFDRFDYKPTQNDTLSLNVGLTRSWFQTPNSFDMQNATAWNGLVVGNSGLGPNGLPVGSTDQVSKIRTFNIYPTWTRVINNATVFTFGVFARQDQFNYYPSANPFADLIPNLQSTTIGQNRRLTNIGGRATLSYVKGIHNIKAGITFENTMLTENDSFGIVDPTFNAVCLNPDASPNTNPLLTNPNNCSGALQPNPGYDPLLACYDLTRTAPLPAANGCPGATSGRYVFSGLANIHQTALYLEDTMKLKNWTVRIGVRGDLYYGITQTNQVEPRAGISYSIKPTSTVLQISYARTMETPFNENLVLSSLGCNDAVVNDLMATVQGYPCLTAPVRPGWRDEYHAALQQAFGRYLVVSGEYIWKYTHRAYDFSVFANTPITFPIEWARSKIPGYAIRATVPNFHGFTAYVVMSSVAARFFTPQVSGIGTTPSSLGAGGVFRIDHDEHFNQTTHLQYQPWSRGPWFSFNWRYDSGLVAGPVPCAGGNCTNGPNGTDTIVDASGLTPDQQFQAGLYCGSVHATPTTPISPDSTCPANLYGSSLVKIPAAGTEDDDHNPPRVASRNLFDLGFGHDNLFHGDRYKWAIRLSVVNLTNQYAVYNFLSTFSGTHYVTPRAFTGTVAFHF